MKTEKVKNKPNTQPPFTILLCNSQCKSDLQEEYFGQKPGDVLKCEHKRNIHLQNATVIESVSTQIHCLAA